MYLSLFNKKSQDDKNSYHSACYKIKNPSDDKKVIYILGAFHAGVSPRLKQSFENFVYDIRPQNVYFEADFQGTKLWQLSNQYSPEFTLGTEYYIHRAASQLGSKFSSLESAWYHSLVMLNNISSKIILPGVKINFEAMQHYQKKEPFWGTLAYAGVALLISILDGIIFSVMMASRLSSKILSALQLTGSLFGGYLGLTNLLTTIKALHAYNNALKVPILNKLSYVSSCLNFAVEVRNEDWVNRVIAPRLEGKEEEPESNSMLYSFLNTGVNTLSRINSLFLNAFNFVFYPVQLLGSGFYNAIVNLLALIGLDAVLQSPFKAQQYNPNSHPVYKKYIEVKNELPSLTYEDFLQHYQKNELDITCLDQLLDALTYIEDDHVAPAGCSDLYVFGAAHLRAPEPFLGFTFNGVIDLLEQKGYQVEEVDMEQYLPKAPLPLARLPKVPAA